jgi:hypothetical protein
MLNTRYDFWQEWVADAGQLYAAAHHFDSVVEARKAHSHALEFHWSAGKQRPSVSDLYAVTSSRDETAGRSRLNGSVSIASGKRLESHPTLT